MKIPDLTSWGTFKPGKPMPVEAGPVTKAGTATTSYGAGAPAGSYVGLKADPGPTEVRSAHFDPYARPMIWKV